MTNANGTHSFSESTVPADAGADDGAQIEWARKQVREERDFFSHAATYGIVISFLFVLDLLTGSGWWFFWPALGWGVAVLIHAFQVFGGNRFGPDREARRMSQLLGRSPEPSADSKNPRPGASEPIVELVRRGTAAVDHMRIDAEQIASADVRREALAICDRADEILRELAEPGRDEAVAREYVDQVLVQAQALYANYARLSSRGIASAEAALRRVESHDLPLLASILNDIHERLHQDELVSLEVASEMLSLGRAAGMNTGTEIGERR